MTKASVDTEAAAARRELFRYFLDLPLSNATWIGTQKHGYINT